MSDQNRQNPEFPDTPAAPQSAADELFDARLGLGLRELDGQETAPDVARRVMDRFAASAGDHQRQRLAPVPAIAAVLVLALGLAVAAGVWLTTQDDLADAPAQGKLAPLLDDQGRVIGAPEGGGGAGGKFGGRARGRSRLGDTGAAIADALGWLRAHQDRDGGWNAGTFMRHDRVGRKCDAPGEGIGRVGITGLCLLPFLGDGNTLTRGDHAAVLRSGIDWLRRQQRASGAYSKELLEHVLATCAVCETAGLSASKVLGKEVRVALEHLAARQNADGGFGAGRGAGPSDPFTTVHAVMAYRSALDFRLTADHKPLERAAKWLGSATARAALPPLAQGPRHAATGTAARLLSRFFIGGDATDGEAVARAAEALAPLRPTAGPEADPVFHYLTAYGLYQVGGRAWSVWSPSLVSAVVATQRDDGNFAGSWDPAGTGARLGGRLYTTALSVLTLQVFYRYTRIVR